MDKEHETEYTRETLLAELNEGGLKPAEEETAWGETWLVARPKA